MDEEARRQLGYLIRKAREDKRLTQIQLAQAIEVKRATIGGYETGTLKFPKMTTLEAIAKKLDVPVTTFLAEAVILPDAASGQLQWFAEQLDARHLRLLLGIARELLREQQSQPQTAARPAARR